MPLSRRHFLRGSLAVAALAGCGGNDPGTTDILLPGPDPDAGSDPDAEPEPERCDDPLAGGELLGVVPLLDGGSPTPGRLTGDGLDARLMTDLAALRPDALVTPTDMYYVRTAVPDALPAAGSWKVRVGGLVDRQVELPIAELLERARDQGTFVMECSGNSTNVAFGLISAGRWRGVPIAELLDRAGPRSEWVAVTGYDRHDGPSETSFQGASWIFSRAELEKARAFLATHLGGEPLTPIHGAPVRLYVPGWYGCVCIKWVERIELVGDDAPSPFHMIEFARRTMQDGEPKRARDFAPATIDQAAMPVRVERWRVGDRVRYLVTGVLWGGQKPSDKVDVRFSSSEAWRRAEVCPAPRSNSTWSLWATVWDPPGPGTYEIACRIDDSSVRQRRLDAGYYLRRVKITSG